MSHTVLAADPAPALLPVAESAGPPVALAADEPGPGRAVATTVPGGRHRAPGSAVAAAPGWRSVGLLTAATIAIGLANYLTSLVAVRFLSAGEFANFAAGQGLLLVLGTGSFAALPWAVARYLARRDARGDDSDAAGKAMHFGMVGSAWQALVLAPVAFGVCWSIGGVTFGLVGAAATAMISLLAGPIGFLQGRERLAALAAVRTLETVVRIAVTLLVIFAVSRSATVVLIAFPVGSVVALAYALHRGRDGFPMRPLGRARALRLTRDAALLGGIQVLLAMLGALDTVYAADSHFTSTQAASYQAAALLARIPLFFSAAVATAAYTGLAGARDEAAAGTQLRASVRTYLWLAAPFLVAYLTLPGRILGLLVPDRYTETLPALRALCFAGVLIGVINVVTTGHQARGRFRTCLVVLVVAVVVQAGVLLGIGRTGHVVAFAAAGAAVCAATVLALVVDARVWLRGLRRPVSSARHLLPVGTVVAGAVAAAFVRQPVAWTGVLVVVGLAAVVAAFTARPHPEPLTPRNSRIGDTA